MLLIDVHAHIDFSEFDTDRKRVLEQCREAGVKVIVNNGVDHKTNRLTQTLAKTYDLIKPAYGFYPTHVEEEGLEAVKAELAWIREQQPFALGEIGLDFKEMPGRVIKKEVQQSAFREFIRLGKSLGIPLIIHSRKAEKEVLDLLEEEHAEKVVLHCFLGKKKLVERARDLGFTFSVPVSVVKLEQLQWLVTHVPMKQLLTETDSPYLGPVAGERNSPLNVHQSIEKMASLLGMTPKDVANAVFMNYQQLFL